MVGSSLPGRDLLKTPPFAPEIKATSKFNVVSFMAQASKNANGDIPVCIYRPNGFGADRIDDWFVILYQGDFLGLVEEYGLGHSSKPHGGGIAEEPPACIGSGLSQRLGSDTDHVSHEAVQDLLSSLLHCLGVKPGNYEVQVSRR